MSDDTTFLKIASQWFIGFCLTLALIAFFFLITAVQVTAEGPGERILRRGVAITAGLDVTLPRVESDLHAAADASETDTVRIPNFPIAIDVPREQATTIGGTDLRTLILDESARRLYEDGMSAWASGDEAGDQNIERVSTAGALHRGFGLLTDTWHTIFLAMAIAAGIICLMLAAMLMISVRSYMRAFTLGAVTVCAAVPSLAAAVGVRFAFRTAETEADAFEKGLIDLGVDTAWVFIRNYLVLGMLGFAVMAMAACALWLQSRSARRPAAATDASIPS